MKKVFFTLSALFLTLGVSATASAHTGLSHYSLSHLLMHIVASVGVYMALMAAGYVAYKYFNQTAKK